MATIDDLRKAVSSAENSNTIHNTLRKLNKQFHNYKTNPKYSTEEKKTISDLIGKLVNFYMGNKTMAILCYPSFSWDDKSQGLPGSEEAVVYLTSVLHKRGYNIVVWGSPEYNDWPSQDKVIYLRAELFDSCRHRWKQLVLWRIFYGHKYYHLADKRYLWLHDYLDGNTDYTQALQNLDGIFWLSEYQRKQAIKHHIGFTKFKSICGNGVILEHFKQDVVKKPYRCIYASNYSRGLETLLRCWPIIKAHYPEASLRIYYGWNTWVAMPKEWHLTMRQLISDLRYLDVKEKGNIDHLTLARKFKKSSFWLYPCNYEETFCITAIKSQLAGAIPIVFTNLGALSETVRFGRTISKIDTNESNEIQFAVNVIKSFEVNENDLEVLRRQMKLYVEKVHTWDRVADRWIATMNGKYVNFNNESIIIK